MLAKTFCNSSVGRRLLGALVIGAILLLTMGSAVANADEYPGSIDNGDGTRTLVYQPSGGANTGTDQGGPTSGKDAGVMTAVTNRGTNHGADAGFHTWNSNCNDFEAKSYFQWDVTGLPPANAVTGVSLVMYHSISRGYGWPYQISPTRMNVQAPAAAWNEMTLTWNNQPATEPAILASVNIPTTYSANAFQGSVSIDITNLYKEWRAGTRSNYGIVYSRPVKFCENANSSIVYSSDSTDALKRPRLEIRYESTSIPTDSTPPSAAPAQSPPANGAGWNSSDVTVNWNWTDDAGGSGVAPSNCSTSSTSTGEGSIALNATCKDVAGNEGSASYTVKVDETPPALTASRTPAANAAGWNNGPVSVHFGASDGLSGILGASFFDVVLDVEGANQGVDHTFWDNAGNPATALVTGVNIDLTKPGVAYSGNAGTYHVDQVVNITCSPGDSLSGVFSTTCSGVTGPAYTFSPGVNTLSATATDNAGNVGSGSTTFSVEVTCDGLASLTRQFVTKAGVASSLSAKLDNACKAGNTNAKAGMVGAFINEIQSQTNKAVSAERAGILINLVNAL